MKIDLHVHSSEISPCSFLSVEQLLDLYTKNEPVDIITVKNKLEEKGVFEL